MKALHRHISALVCTLWCICACALPVDTRQGCINDRIRTLQVKAEGDFFAPPVIRMGSDDRLVISFDHLAEDREYLRYELVHCNADWQPSGLVDSEFLDGFNLGNIDTYDFSRQTTVHYVHYSLTIPNEEVAPKLSGNYLLKIYPENDPDDVWAQARFMVSEQTAPIDIEINTRTDKDYNDRHQQLSIAVDTERSRVEDPFNDITVIVSQNGRLDNQTVLHQPLRMAGRNRLVYEHLPALIFPAGNEYRRFENVSTRYPGMRVEGISYREPYYMFDLATDHPRTDEMYTYDQTQNGRYLIREYDSDDSDTEADYTLVLFTLDAPEMPDAMVFIDGDLTDRRLGPESLMVYNKATGRYERVLLLKQGSYNYQYITVPKGSDTGLTAPIEGDKYQTANEYLVMVYARHPGDRYDRLIGVTQIR